MRAAEAMQYGMQAVKLHLVEISEQPGLGGSERADAPKGIPDGQRAPDKLVAPGRVHGVDAQVGAAQANRPLWGGCARWVVLGHHQAMPAE